MNIAKILEQHQESFLNAKNELVASRLKQPDRQFPVKVKKRTVATLRARVASIAIAKEESAQEYDALVRSLSADIERLEKEIESDSALLDESQPMEKISVSKKRSRSRKKRE